MNNLTRIATNTEALRALSSLNRINTRAAVHQYRLSTGKRINSAQDDTAGYSIAKGLQARTASLNQAKSNVTTASSILNIAEGGYQAQMSILQTIKAKVTQAADASTAGDPRTAIDSQVTELLDELDDISTQTKWNGSAMFSTSSTMTFHVGADAGDTFTVTFDQSTSDSVGSDTTDLTAIDLSSATSASLAMTAVTNAIKSLAKSIQAIGDKQVRLASKEEMLTSNAVNTDAIRSSVEDADFAREQMEAMKLQILQQTSITALTQANSAPQSVLSLFR